jgi:hypothetical protein
MSRFFDLISNYLISNYFFANQGSLGNILGGEKTHEINTPLPEHSVMLAQMDLVERLMAGSFAMRDAGQTFLPKLPREIDKDYQFRLSLSRDEATSI